MFAREWKPFGTTHFIIFFVSTLLLFAVIVFDEDGFILVLDHANLAFHEAGHVIFGLFGQTLGLYGGTLGQLVFPVAVAVTFYRQASLIPYALALIWFCENLLNIARYMADARERVLPLVGGGEHDWVNILNNWGLLSSDRTLAGLVRWLAWLGMFFVLYSVWRQWQRHGRSV